MKSRNAFLFLLFYCYLGKTLFFTSSILTVDLQSFLHLNIVWAKCKESVPDGDLCLTSSVKLSLVLDAFHYLNFCILLPLQYFNLQKEGLRFSKSPCFVCMSETNEFFVSWLFYLSCPAALLAAVGWKSTRLSSLLLLLFGVLRVIYFFPTTACPCACEVEFCFDKYKSFFLSLIESYLICF